MFRKVPEVQERQEVSKVLFQDVWGLARLYKKSRKVVLFFLRGGGGGARGGTGQAQPKVVASAVPHHCDNP